jgi:triacylglycerol lipase
MPHRARRSAVLLLVVVLPTAACFSEGSPEPVPAALDTSRQQVVLVHGIWDTAAKFDKMSAALKEAGWQSQAISLVPNDASVTLERSAGELRRFIDARLGPDLHFSMVAFSMGGLVARYYLQRLDGLQRLNRLVTISTPHHGTWTANFDGLPGAVEMRPGSPFLEDLNSDIMALSAVPVTTIWSPQDIGIQPPDSSRLPLGSNVIIPNGRHAAMLTDDRVIRAVLAALTQQSRDQDQ